MFTGMKKLGLFMTICGLKFPEQLKILKIAMFASSSGKMWYLFRLKIHPETFPKMPRKYIVPVANDI